MPIEESMDIVFGSLIHRMLLPRWAYKLPIKRSVARIIIDQIQSNRHVFTDCVSLKKLGVLLLSSLYNVSLNVKNNLQIWNQERT